MRMNEQLVRAGLGHEFIEGVDGQALTASDRRRLVDEAAVARYPGWLTPEAIGCGLSHLRAYERIAEVGNDEKVALVLEDDAVIDPRIALRLAEIEPHMHGSEVVLLYFRSHSLCRFSAQDAVDLPDGTRILYPLAIDQLTSAVAYLITHEACARLAEAIAPLRVAADSWGDFYQAGAIESVRCVVPRPVGHSRHFNSTVGYREPGSLRSRVIGFAGHRKLSPFFPLVSINRHLVERRMSKITVTPERSPVACRRIDGGGDAGQPVTRA